MATEFKHTPGPWHFFPSADGFPRVYLGGGYPSVRELFGPYIVINSCEPSADMAGHEANARLIAASPDLLEALQETVAKFDAAPDSVKYTALGINKCRAAIAKATGQ